jgi:Leucine-rich repeat (LRR) protein
MFMFLSIVCSIAFDIKVTCNYELCTRMDTNHQLQGCVNSNIPDVTKRASFSFESFQNESNIDCFEVKNKILKFLPSGIDTQFPNLKLLRIAHSNLQEITPKDLKGFVNLGELSFIGNEIKVIEKDLFHHNEKLYFVSFEKNKLKFIHPDAFDHLVKLTYLDFKNNDCIGDTYLPFRAIEDGEKVEQIIRELLKGSEWIAE